MKRRAFCAHACQAMSLVAVGAALPGCGGGSPTSPSGAGPAASSDGGSPTTPSGSSVSSLATLTGTVSNRTVSVTVGAGSPLANVGGTALVRTNSGNFLATRISDVAFSALTAVCTHEGCTITDVAGTTFVCPCHGSQFSTGGAVVKSPATKSLTVFATEFSNGILTITF